MSVLTAEQAIARVRSIYLCADDRNDLIDTIDALREQIATAERRGAEKALEIADVGCFILHPRGTCKQCDAWRYARGEASEPEGRK